MNDKDGPNGEKNQMQLEWSGPRGSCFKILLIKDTVERNEPNAVYFFNIPLEDSTVPNYLQSSAEWTQ